MRLRRKPSAFAFLKDYPRVLPYLRPHKGLAGAALAMVGASSLAALLAPWPLAILIDTVLGNEPLPSLLGALDAIPAQTLLVVAVVAGLLVTALEHGLAVVDDYVNVKLEQSMILGLRSDLFRHAQRLSMAFHDTKRTGQLMYQINNQASAVGAVTVAVPPVLKSVVTLVGMFVIVYLIEPDLALVSLVVVPFIYWSAGYYTRRIHPQVIEVRNLEGQSLSVVHEAMAMLRVIVAFGREEYEYGRFRHVAEHAVDARVRLTIRQTVFALVVTLTTAAGSALVLWIGARGVLSGDMTAGELLVVMGYIASLYKPLEEISNTISGLQEQFISLRHALDLLDTAPEIDERPGALAIGRVRGDVHFDRVSFRYPGRAGTLKTVTFHARAGQRVAIVGPTGAGKSTLLSLLPRFYDPKDGWIKLDGHDVRDLRLASLRAQIAVVHQEPLLFSGTIRDNIRYGRLEATDAEVEQAARDANAHDFIAALPHGYETELGERGAQLSGGERQRISVARAFLKDAPILILDEPTSAVDSQTEGVILDALERLVEGRTTFMVAHRLSTVVDADQILVVKAGQIAERGTHTELLAASGLYRQLYDAQHGGRRRRAATESLGGDSLAELTTAIADGEASGPALAELARAMTRGPEPRLSWRLVAAAGALLHEGDPALLRALADQEGDLSSARLARELLRDLGLDRPDHLKEAA